MNKVFRIVLIVAIASLAGCSTAMRHEMVHFKAPRLKPKPIFELRAREDHVILAARANEIMKNLEVAIANLAPARLNRSVSPERFFILRTRNDENVDIWQAKRFPRYHPRMGDEQHLIPSDEIRIMTVTHDDVRSSRTKGAWATNPTVLHQAGWYLALIQDYYRVFVLHRPPTHTAGIHEAAVLRVILENALVGDQGTVNPDSLERAVEYLDERNFDLWQKLVMATPRPSQVSVAMDTTYQPDPHRHSVQSQVATQAKSAKRRVEWLEPASKPSRHLTKHHELAQGRSGPAVHWPNQDRGRTPIQRFGPAQATSHRQIQAANTPTARRHISWEAANDARG